MCATAGRCSRTSCATDGQRSVLLSIIKNGKASTLDVVNGVKEALPGVRAAAPPGMKIKELFDQSVFVTQLDQRRAARRRHRGRADRADDPAVPRLLALDPGGDDLDPAVDPVLDRRAVLPRRDHQHDDAGRPCAGGRHPGRRFHRHDREHPPPAGPRSACRLPMATLHGAAGIAVPTLVSTLAISCVFISVVFLDGPAKYLFTPLGLAVVFAMLASYGLSRTLTPITIGLLLKSERHGTRRRHPGGLFCADFRRLQPRFRASARQLYADCCTVLLRRRFIVPVVAVLDARPRRQRCSTFVGRDFFPLIDAGQIQLHVRAPAGTRIEETEQIFQAVEDKIRETFRRKSAG